MVRGTWDAMKWLLATYPAPVLREFIQQRGVRTLPPKVLAFWALVSGADVTITPGGARPRWLDA